MKKTVPIAPKIANPVLYILTVITILLVILIPSWTLYRNREVLLGMHKIIWNSKV